MVYWYTVVIATDTDDDGDANPVGDDGNLVAGSVEDKTLIVDTTDGPRLVKYDGNDVFLVGDRLRHSGRLREGAGREVGDAGRDGHMGGIHQRCFRGVPVHPG